MLLLLLLLRLRLVMLLVLHYLRLCACWNRVLRLRGRLRRNSLPRHSGGQPARLGRSFRAVVWWGTSVVLRSTRRLLCTVDSRRGVVQSRINSINSRISTLRHGVHGTLAMRRIRTAISSTVPLVAAYIIVKLSSWLLLLLMMWLLW